MIPSASQKAIYSAECMALTDFNDLCQYDKTFPERTQSRDSAERRKEEEGIVK